MKQFLSPLTLCALIMLLLSSCQDESDFNKEMYTLGGTIEYTFGKKVDSVKYEITTLCYDAALNYPYQCILYEQTVLYTNDRFMFTLPKDIDSKLLHGLDQIYGDWLEDMEISDSAVKIFNPDINFYAYLENERVRFKMNSPDIRYATDDFAKYRKYTKSPALIFTPKSFTVKGDKKEGKFKTYTENVHYNKGWNIYYWEVTVEDYEYHNHKKIVSNQVELIWVLYPYGPQ